MSNFWLNEYERGLSAAAEAGPAIWNEQIRMAFDDGYNSVRHMIESVTAWSSERIDGYLDGMGATDQEAANGN